MRINFILNRSGHPEKKLADVEIHFDEGLLAGLKLTGFAVWRGNGARGPFVTFPSRPYEDATGRRFFEYLRPSSTSPLAARKFRDYIIEEYLKISESEA
ncbi:MAG: hypothetical protein D6713_02705 [Deltaproteobacteria bacterium]|nr:MAG: hypothetical protein D6713_02705 [Deltaproteobacteria bacterium]